MTPKTFRKPFCLLIGAMLLMSVHACVSIPKGAVAVENFDKNKYLGKWYEIARMDFRFERNLQNTTAQYSLNKNGSIRVDNQGYDTLKGKWKQAIGKAKFVGAENKAMLKVSFFGPFYSGYNVLAIDSNYQYALIAGANLRYLWILSRNTSIPGDIKEQYLNIARSNGYNTDNLLWIKQEHSK